MDKFDINTFFRLVIPGYLAIFIYYLFQWDILVQQNVPLLLFIGIPIGFVIHVIYRYFFKKVEEHMIDKDVQAIREFIPNLDGINSYLIAKSLDYVLMTDPELEKLNYHIRFLYSRMHSYGKSIIAVIFSGVVCIIKNLPNYFPCEIVLRVSVLAVLLFFLFKNYIFLCEVHIPDWRRLIIRTHGIGIEDTIRSLQNI